MSTGTDIITGALLEINATAVGQSLPPSVAQVCLIKLNDLMDSLSNDQAFIFTTIENIFNWIPGQYQYSVGNPEAGFFLGNVTGLSNVITNVGVPANLAFGGVLTDLGGALPANTTIVSFNAVANTVTMSQPALFTVSGLDNVTYTVPGNIILNSGLPMSRPLRIRSGFTRLTGGVAQGLDYFLEVKEPFERYTEIGFKGVAGPWPYILSYQTTFPYGNFWVYPNPSTGEAHLFTDLILSQFTLTEDVPLPQGYSRALKKLTALELCPMFGKTPSPQLILQAKEAKTLLQETNASPVVTLRYDSDLVYSRHTDASWIMDGGFR